MKLNQKIYKNLTGEPFLVQDIDGQKVSFYDMNETPYLTQYAGRGKFAIWTTNGGDDYKVLIERSYYEALKPFYEYNVNKIWLNFLTSASSITRKINLWFLVPTMSLYVIIAALATIFLPNYVLQVLLGLIVVVFVSNIVQTRLTSKKIKEANFNAQDQIKEALGVVEFESLIQAQEEHYKAYFKFEDDEVTNEEPIELDAEEVEEEKEDK
jgi:hypothetical protein